MTFESAIERAAVLVKSLSQDQARKLLLGLESDELQKVFQRVRSIGNISDEQKRIAIQSFLRAAKSRGRTDFRLKNPKKLTAFEFLQDASASVVHELLKNEHPNDVAIAVTYLPAELAADTLSYFEPNSRIMVLKRICRLRTIDDRDVQNISNRIESQLEKHLAAERSEDVGMDTVTRVLSCTDPFTRTKILDQLQRHDPELGRQIEQRVFCYQDLKTWDDALIRDILPWIDTSLWAPALKTSNRVLRRKLLRCFAERPRIILKRELNSIRKIDPLIAERARGAIVREIMRLVDEGKISLPKPGGRKAA